MHPRTSQQAQEQATHAMMGSLFRAPRPSRVALVILGGSLLIGLLANGLALSLETLYLGLGGIALPVVASGFLTKPLAERLGGRMYYRRSFLLGLLGMGPLLVAALASLLVPGASVVRFLLVAWAATLWLRQAVILATSHSSPLRSLPAVVNQPVLGLLGLLPFFSPLASGDLVVTTVAFAAFYATGLLFTEVAIIPLERGFGVDGLSMMRHSLDHMTEKGRAGTQEMESFFASFASPVSVPVAVLTVRQEDDRLGLWVVANLHPGPYGQLGGSDLPTKLKGALADLEAEVLVPHGPSTHDQNPATSREAERLASWARTAVERAEPRARASRFVRVRENGVNVGCQIFGDTALLLGSLAPQPTDDIDFATGYAAVLVAKESGAEEAVLVDAHNCIEPGSGAVVFGSPECYALLDGVRRAVQEAQAGVGDGLRVGWGEDTALVDAERGLGPNGIQAMVAQVDGQRTAYLLFDGNNMVPGLREEILEGVGDLVDEAEVLTSDNHVVNNTLPGFNPVGWRQDREALVRAARRATEAALTDLRPAGADGRTGVLEDVAVWGYQSAVRLTTAIHSSLATMGINAAVTFLLATVASLLGLALVP